MTQYSGKIIRKTPVVPTQQSASGVWTVDDAAVAVKNNIWPVAGVPDPISRSVRLRSSASAYLNRTMTTATNNLKWTWSAWIKRGTLTTSNPLFYGGDGSSNNFGGIAIRADDMLQFAQVSGGSYNVQVYTTAVFRDPSAWYHIVIVYDSANATSTDRVQIYVNGVRQTSLTYATGPFAQNTASKINSAVAHYTGKIDYTAAYPDCYIAENNFIDGQALTPSSFGTTDTQTGAWIPMAYTGTYGTNGFYLNFKDNTSTTTLGYDYSGNSNNWTANNISLTAGATYDSMLDVPTPWVGYSATTDTTAVTRGNYAVLNPLGVDSPSSTTANGNLTLSNSASNQKRATIPVMGTDTNKYYWEVTVNGTATGNFPNMGMYVVGAGTNWVGYDGNSIGLYQGGGLYYNGSLVATLTSFADTNVISIAYDPVTGKIWFAKNGTWMASGDPATGTSPNYTLPTGVDRVAGGYTGSGYGTLEFNFGQRPFAYTPPTGFKTLCVTNLPTPTIKLGASYMAATLWTGDGTSSRAIANSANNTTSTSFQPDFVWQKARSGSSNLSHALYDSVRGATKLLSSDQTSAESTLSTGVTAFNSDGFQIGTWPNQSSQAQVAWQWKAAGSTVSNTSGTITSTVSANTTAGFSIVTYTGTGANATVGHGLGAAPKMIILKQRNSVDYWVVWQTTLANTEYLLLNSTNGKSTAATYWNSTSPTSTVFSLGTDSRPNGSGTTYVAYCWAEIAGYSKFGSYTGNGSSDGTFVYLGFRPRYICVKRTDSTQNWITMDTSRGTYNCSDPFLYPNLSNAEDANAALDILSNGFKWRSSALGGNDSGGTFIYMAFAENPFKYSNAR